MLQAVSAPVWDRAVNPALGYRYSSAEGLAYRVRRFAAYLGCDRDAAYARTMSVWRNPEQLLGFQSKHPLGADAVHYPELSWAEEMMLIDQGNYLQDDILTKVDRASMAVSLEARVPLLTHPLVEWSWQIAPSLKLADRGDRGKLVLRELLYRHVPKALIERPKQGFGMPVGKWLRGPLKDWAVSLLNPADLEACGLNSRVVADVWREHQMGLDRQAMLWTVLMYRQWHLRVKGK
jgi:asparagine synthase (glutamine-hydrolysing)